MGRTKFDFCFAIPSTEKCFIMEHKLTGLPLPPSMITVLWMRGERDYGGKKKKNVCWNWKGYQELKAQYLSFKHINIPYQQFCD